MQMEKATWEEIKLLASDFKRTQLISSIQKLTERNCIDIINYLCAKKELMLYFTTDGKTFLTHEELEKEINEELEISNGRIELTTLSQLLDIDLYTIETVVNKMTCSDSNLQLVMGCLLNSSYNRGIALKINEIIKDNGKISVLELTQQFKLPKSMIEKIITTNIDSGIIQAHKDEDIIYTNDFIRRHRAIICGYLTRSSKPVSIGLLSEKFSISKKLSIRLISELNDQHRHGISGKFDQHKSQFIPDRFVKNQRYYLHSFYQRNYYLDYEMMREIGIANPARYVATEFPDMTTLATLALGDGLMSQMTDALDECDSQSMLFSCYHIVPRLAGESDLQLLMEKLIKLSIERKNQFFLMANEFIVSRKFIQRLVRSFDDVIRERSEHVVKTNRKATLVQLLGIGTGDSHGDADFSMRSSEASQGSKTTAKFKSGGGLTGREVKVKSVKNKYVPGNVDKKSTGKKSSLAVTAKAILSDHDESKAGNQQHHQLELMSEDEAVDWMKSIKCFESLDNAKISTTAAATMTTIISESNRTGDLPESLLRELFRLIEPQLNAEFKQRCQQIFVNASQSGQRNKARDHQQIESRLTQLVNRLKLFDGSLHSSIGCGTAAGEFAELKSGLSRFLMKTIAADIVNAVFEYVAIDNDLEWCDDAGKINDGMRSKLICQLNKNDLLSTALKSLNKSLKDGQGGSEESVVPFLSSLETVCGMVDLFPVKKGDTNKKTDRNLSQEIAAQYQSIIRTKIDSGNEIDIEPSELLLVTVALIFQKITGGPLHASGKFVPALLEFLRYKATVLTGSRCSASDGVVGDDRNYVIDWPALNEYQDYVISSVKMTNCTQEEKDTWRKTHNELHSKIVNLALNWKSIKL